MQGEARCDGERRLWVHLNSLGERTFNVEHEYVSTDDVYEGVCVCGHISQSLTLRLRRSLTLRLVHALPITSQGL